MYFVDFFLYIIFQVLQIYKYAVIIYVILSMLISFNIINTNNRIISIVMDFLFKLIEPLLRVIRNVIPNFGAIDVSPVILIIIIEAFQYIMTKYGF
jgi:YggT family protein